MSTRCRLAATILFYAAKWRQGASFAWRLTLASRRFTPKAPVRLHKRRLQYNLCPKGTHLKALSSRLLAHSRSSNEAKRKYRLNQHFPNCQFSYSMTHIPHFSLIYTQNPLFLLSCVWYNTQKKRDGIFLWRS